MQDTPEPQHARLGPSGSSGWTACSAFPHMAELYGDDSSSEPAEEGTAAHEVFEVSLIKREPPLSQIGMVYNKTPAFPEGWVVTEEMSNTVTMAYDFIMGKMTDLLALDPDTRLFAERKVNPGTWIGRDDCWGTADVTIVCPNIGRVYVYDYKHGRGIFVSVVNNLQAILYLIGALAELPAEQMVNIKQLVIGIIQPRCFQAGEAPIREQEISLSSIPRWVEFFRETAALTDDPNPTYIPGEKQCQWCDGKPHCKAATDMVIAQLTDVPGSMLGMEGEQFGLVVSEATAKDPEKLSDNHLVAILEHADMIRGFVKACEGYATDTMLRGTPSKALMEAFKLVAGGSQRKFAEEVEVTIKKLKGMKLRKNDYMKETLLGIPAIIANASKVLLKEDGSVLRDKLTERQMANLDKLIIKPAGKLTLVPMADVRKSAKPTTPEEMFGGEAEST